MSIKRLRLSILVLLLIVSGVGGGVRPVVHAQGDAIPYIHYYDYLHHGLIIERADGTDSRIISDLLPEEHNTLVWHGWSPSGKWFALSSYEAGDYGRVSAEHIQVVRTDGQARISLGSYDAFGPYLSWAPDSDTLLLAGSNTDNKVIEFQLFDVETARILAQTTITGYNDTGAFFASEGERAYIHLGRANVITLHQDGLVALTNYVRYPPADYSAFFQRRLLATWLQRDGGAQVTIRDIEDGRQIEFEDPSGNATTCYAVRWSPTLAHTLVYATSCYGVSDDESWLKLVDWESGEVTPVFPAIKFNSYCSDSYACTQFWSPQGNYALLNTEQHEVYLLDLHTGATRQIAVDDHVAYYHWTSDERLLFAYYEEYVPHVYDPATNQEEILSLPEGIRSSWAGIFPSPDGQYVGLSSDPATIIDRSGTIVAQSIGHSHSTPEYRAVWNYTWHPAGEWVLADYLTAFARSGGGPTAAVVFDLAGTTRRELPPDGEAGFVPVRAVPYLSPGQPTSIKKDPVFTLPQAGQVYSIGWHPTDPDRLVTYSYEAGLIFWSLASGQPEITDRIALSMPLPSYHPFGSKLFWLPDQNRVAFNDLRALRQIDLVTGNVAPIDGLVYPVLVVEGDQAAIWDSVSGEATPLNVSRPSNYPTHLTSGRDGLIFNGEGADIPSLYYVDAASGAITRLDVSTTVYTADARDGIAVLGSLYDCCVIITSTTTGRVIDRFYGTAYSLALSADGQRLATTSQGMTAIWDVSEYLVDNLQNRAKGAKLRP